MRTADLIGGLFLTAFALLFTFNILPAQTSAGRWAGTSPIFFPTVFGVLLAVFSVVLVIQSIGALRQRKADSKAESLDTTEEKFPITIGQAINTVIAVALTLGAVLVIDWYGFIYGAPLLVFVMMVYMGERHPLRLILLSAAAPAAIYMFAYHVMRMPLP